MPADLTYGPIFRRRLLSIRDHYGWTQVQASRKIGMPNAMLCHYETGNRQPTVENLTRLADGYDVSIDWLLGRSHRQEVG